MQPIPAAIPARPWSSRRSGQPRIGPPPNDPIQDPADRPESGLIESEPASQLGFGQPPGRSGDEGLVRGWPGQGHTSFSMRKGNASTSTAASGAHARDGCPLAREPRPAGRTRMADERALGVSFIYAAQTCRQLAAVCRKQEVWALLGLTNVLVMLVARRMAGFSQETSDLVQTRVSRTKLADRHYGRPHLLRGMPKVVRCYLSIVLRPAV